MISIKIRVLRECDAALADIGDRDLPPAVAFKIGRMLSAVGTEMRAFQPVWMKLLEKHGTAVEDKPGAYNIPAEKIEAFAAEADPLLDAAISLNCDKVKIAECSDVKLKPSTLAALEWFFEA